MHYLLVIISDVFIFIRVFLLLVKIEAAPLPVVVAEEMSF